MSDVNSCKHCHDGMLHICANDDPLTEASPPDAPKFAVGDWWETRDGRKTRIVCVDRVTTGACCVICLIMIDGTEDVFSVNNKGCRWTTGTPADLDLIKPWKEPIKVEGWANTYPNGTTQMFYATKQNLGDARKQADLGALPQRSACVYVSGTEGVEPDA